MSAPARVGSGAPQAAVPPGALVGHRFQVRGFSRADGELETYDAIDTSNGGSLTLRFFTVPTNARAVLESDLANVARLVHKNLTTIVGFGEHDGRIFVAVEPHDGHTLRQLIDAKRGQGQTVGTAYAQMLLAHVANGLEELYKVSAHGGLNPESLWVSRAGRVKIDDVGLTRAVPSIARRGGPPGAASGAYVAPEVAKGAGATAASDVYSMGALLYELLTGAPPTAPLRPPSQVAPEIPPTVDAVVARALAAQPHARFRTPAELVTALGAAIGPISPPAPQTAGPGSPTGRVFNVAEAAGMSEDQERWLVQKDKLDYGPFSLAQVMSQLQRGVYRPDDLIVDIDTGERLKIKDHPQLGDFARHAERQLEAVRRAQAEQVQETVEKKKSRATLLILGTVVTGLGIGLFFYFSSRKAAQDDALAARVGEADVDAFLKNVKFGFNQKKKPAPARRSPGGGGGKADEFSSALNLGDVTKGGGDEILSDHQIQQVMMRNYRKLVPCIMQQKSKNAGLSDIDLEFVVKGSGTVAAVKVNGQQKGDFPECVLGRMKGFDFPKFNGDRTVASWSMSMN